MRCHFFVVLVAVATGLVRAESPPWAVDSSSSEAKALARAKYAAVHADPESLRRARVAALREEFDARFKQFLAGKGTLDFLLRSTTRLGEAEAELGGTDAPRVAILERFWAVWWLTHQIDQGRFDSGKASVENLMRARYDLRGAEIAWIEARRLARGFADGPALTALLPYLEYEGPEELLARGKQLARAKRLTLAADVGQLARDRVEAAEVGFDSRFNAFGSILEFVLESRRLWSKAQLTLLANDREKSAVLDQSWRPVFRGERNLERGFENGRVAFQDLMAIRVARLTGQIDWLQARAKAVEGPYPFLPIPRSRLGLEDSDQVKLYARARRAAVKAGWVQLVRERVDPAFNELDARFKEFLAGKGTLAFLETASARLVEAEEAVAATPAERLAAMEQQWQRAWLVERVNQARFEAGKVDISDLVQSRDYRLEAELKWLRARGQIGPK